MRHSTHNFMLKNISFLLAIMNTALAANKTADSDPSLCLEPGSFELVFNKTIPLYLSSLIPRLTDELPKITGTVIATNSSMCAPTTPVASLCCYGGDCYVGLYANSSRFDISQGKNISSGVETICDGYFKELNQHALTAVLAIITLLMAGAIGVCLYDRRSSWLWLFPSCKKTAPANTNHTSSTKTPLIGTAAPANYGSVGNSVNPPGAGKHPEFEGSPSSSGGVQEEKGDYNSLAEIP